MKDILSTATERKALAEVPLSEMADYFQTDKNSTVHGYAAVYEGLFAPLRHTAQRVLEIGVEYGDSLRLWETYFTKAKIIGIDIIPQLKGRGRIAIMRADQASFPQLVRVGERFGPLDIIIDDGSHNHYYTANTYAALWPYLRVGGYYVVEDLNYVLDGQIFFYQDPRCKIMHKGRLAVMRKPESERCCLDLKVPRRSLEVKC